MHPRISTQAVIFVVIYFYGNLQLTYHFCKFKDTAPIAGRAIPIQIDLSIKLNAVLDLIVRADVLHLFLRSDRHGVVSAVRVLRHDQPIGLVLLQLCTEAVIFSHISVLLHSVPCLIQKLHRYADATVDPVDLKPIDSVFRRRKRVVIFLAPVRYTIPKHRHARNVDCRFLCADVHCIGTQIRILLHNDPIGLPCIQGRCYAVPLSDAIVIIHFISGIIIDADRHQNALIDLRDLETILAIFCRGIVVIHLLSFKLDRIMHHRVGRDIRRVLCLTDFHRVVPRAGPSFDLERIGLPCLQRCSHSIPIACTVIIIHFILQRVIQAHGYEGQFAVILAGYPADMDRLMQANEGLPRRFPTVFTLSDYTPEEMRQIFLKVVSAQQDPPVSLSPELEERLEDFFASWVGGNVGRRSWGNAGECQNLLSKMCNHCKLRESAQQIHRPGYLLTPEDIPEELQHCLAPLSKDYNEALKKIDDMIGLSNVKTYLRQLAQNIRLGKNGDGPGNFAFIGVPGTGKTTVARLMGELLGQLHVLRRTANNVTEVKAADLLNGKVDLNSAVEEARGGIFFLDEAPQLTHSSNGEEIIRALVPLIDDPAIRTDTCFILAGYPEGIPRVLEVDSGLERRFPKQRRIYFQNYTAVELTQILETMAEARGLKPTKEYLQRSRAALYTFLHKNHDPNFGNAGYIRDTYLPNSINAQTRRLAQELTGSPDGIATDEQLAALSKEKLMTLTEKDIPADMGPVSDKPIPAEPTALEQVQALLGKDDVKAYAQLRTSGGDDPISSGGAARRGNLVYAISGPTGCGRRTAARALAALWRESGLLNSDDIHYASKGDLESGYVGQTADRVRSTAERAVGGTLAILSPSSMVPQSSQDHSYGPEAIGALTSFIAAHESDTSFVFIDSDEGLDLFFKTYPSMRSQMNRIFAFDALTPAQMKQLFLDKTRYEMQFEPELEALLDDFFLNWVSRRGDLGDASRSWSNGVEVDRLIEELQSNWRIAGGETRTQKVTQDGVEYSFKVRYIQREHFPKKLQRYLKQTTVLSDGAMAKLDALPGLYSVKASIRGIQRRIRFLGNAHSKPGCYLYLGNPGVGKTTVASLMGGVLKAAGVLSQGHVISRTAREMQSHLQDFESILKLARGGILFIDEAHQLGEDGNYAGNEVIKRLLTVLEDDSVTDVTCIILAGYPGPMMRLLQRDEGLSSRFGSEDSIILFEDYDTDALMQVLDYMAARADQYTAIGAVRPLSLSEGYRQRTRTIFDMVVARHDSNFGNARFVRTYLHDSLNAQLRRLDAEYNSAAELPDSVADLLTEEDIPNRFRTRENAHRRRLQLPNAALSTVPSDQIIAANIEQITTDLSKCIVYLEVYQGSQMVGEASGTIITKDGIVLTCEHVVRAGSQFRARIYCPGAPGGSYRWFNAVPLEPICSDCDMAALKLDGNNFTPAALAPADAPLPLPGEKILMLGYPLGRTLNGNNPDTLKFSYADGTVSSVQEIGTVQRCYCNITGLHGNSGSPIFSKKDQRIIGVFSGSVRPDPHSLDELNYFYPIRHFWERFTRQPLPDSDSV